MVLLDIGYETEGVILSLSFPSSDVNPDDVVAVGDQIEALVLQKEDKEGRLLLSKRADTGAHGDELRRSRKRRRRCYRTESSRSSGRLILDIPACVVPPRIPR